MFNTLIQRSDVIRETDKAICVSVDTGQLAFGRDRQVWLPKSAIEWKAEGNFHETLHVEEWARRKLFG